MDNNYFSVNGIRIDPLTKQKEFLYIPFHGKAVWKPLKPFYEMPNELHKAFFVKVKRIVNHSFPGSIPQIFPNKYCPNLYLMCHHGFFIHVQGVILKGNDLKFEFTDGDEMWFSSLVNQIGSNEFFTENPKPKKAQGIYYFLVHEMSIE